MSEAVHDDDVHARLRADSVEWKALSIIGFQRSDTRDPDDVIELRNCTCGSTLGRRRRISMSEENKYTEDAAGAASNDVPTVPGSTKATESVPQARGSRSRISTTPTVRLDPANLKPTWPVVSASLEQMSDWEELAFRL